MHETYRMLGKEHEADLEREARRRDLAAAGRHMTQRHTSPRIALPKLSLRSLAFGLSLGTKTTVRDGR